MSGLQNRGSEASSQIGDLRIKSIAPREQAVRLKLPAGMVEFALGIREFLGQAMPPWCHGDQRDTITQG